MSDGSSIYAVHVDVPAVAGLYARIVVWDVSLTPGLSRQPES